MSKTFRVSPLEKKSIQSTDIYEKTIDGVLYRAELEHWYRWGYAVLAGVENKEDLTQGDSLEIYGYEVEDHNYDDGVAAYWYYSDDTPEEVREEVERLWDEGSLEENDWSHIDNETFFHGPLEIELVSEEEDDAGETVAPKSAWPF